MNHPSFDLLPLDDEEELQTGKDHLRDCPQCQEMQSAWQAVHRQIKSTPMANPSAGFTQRWQASLAERRALQQRMQVRRLFLGLVTANILVAGALGLTMLFVSSPAQWFNQLIGTLAQTFLRIELFEQNILSWLRIVPPSLSILLWVVISSGVALLCLTWVATIWRVSIKGATQNETNH